MTRWLLALGLVAACGGGLPSYRLAGLKAEPRSASYQDHVASSVLPNGLKVAVLPDARTNLVTVMVRYETGAADDPPEYLGLAHYVEHLLYLASQDGREDVALSGNAMTLLDRTYFYQTGLGSQLETLAETAARRFEVGCHDMTPTVLERERDVVIEEVKQRSRSRWNMDGIEAALWGAGHPYAHSPGGTTFTAIPRDALCSYIEGHYGPGGATLVIAGNIDEATFARIRERFARIPARAIAPRPQLPPFDDHQVRVRVPGLERATVVLAFRAPGEIGRSAAAIRLFEDMYWRRQRMVLRTSVIGDERARLIIAYVEVDDPTKVDEVAAVLRSTFADATVAGLPVAKQRVRTQIVHSFDDLEDAALTIANLAARGAPMTRYRTFRDIDDIKDVDLAHWVDGAPARLVVMLPDSDLGNAHSIAEIATELHHLELLHRETSVDLAPPPPPPVRPRSDVVAETLPNGLHVLYAPDRQSIGIDARIVMPGDPGSGRDLVVAFEAANELMPPPVDGEELHVARWYATVGVPVEASVSREATTLAVSGFSLFGDWHVWNLARTVVAGDYPWIVDEMLGRRVMPQSSEPPDVFAVLARRLGVLPPIDQIEQVSRATLRSYRDRHYDPRHATLIIAGNFDLAAMRTEVTTLFARWHASGAAPAASSPPAVQSGFVAIPVLHANTLEIGIAFAPSTRSDHAHDAARAVLQQIINERLRVVRESLGVSYGVSAGVTSDAIIAGGDIEPAYAADGARAILDALAHVRDGDDAFTADFVAARKQVLAHALAQPLGASARARQLQRIVETGDAPDAVDANIEAIRTLDIAAVRDLAARALSRDRMITVVRGEAAPVKAALAAFGATAFDTVSR